ncbi:MAG: hypothetical protein ACT4PL_11850 [Phycisphaerales bacterium]
MPGTLDPDLRVYRMTLPDRAGASAREVYLWPEPARPPRTRPNTCWVLLARTRTLTDIPVASLLFPRLKDTLRTIAKEGTNSGR